MLPNEVAILMAIKENEELGVQRLTHVTDIAGSFLRYICNSLCLRGYLECKNPKGYQARRKGKKTIFDALRVN